MLLGEQYDATEEGYVDSEEKQGSKSTPNQQFLSLAAISSPPYGSPQSPSDRPQFLHARRVTDGLLNLTGNVSIAANSFGSTALSACVCHRNGR